MKRVLSFISVVVIAAFCSSITGAVKIDTSACAVQSGGDISIYENTETVTSQTGQSSAMAPEAEPPETQKYIAVTVVSAADSTAGSQRNPDTTACYTSKASSSTAIPVVRQYLSVRSEIPLDLFTLILKDKSITTQSESVALELVYNGDKPGEGFNYGDKKHLKKYVNGEWVDAPAKADKLGETTQGRELISKENPKVEIFFNLSPYILEAGRYQITEEVNGQLATTYLTAEFDIQV